MGLVSHLGLGPLRPRQTLRAPGPKHRPLAPHLAKRVLVWWVPGAGRRGAALMSLTSLEERGRRTGHQLLLRCRCTRSNVAPPENSGRERAVADPGRSQKQCARKKTLQRGQLCNATISGGREKQLAVCPIGRSVGQLAAVTREKKGMFGTFAEPGSSVWAMVGCSPRYLQQNPRAAVQQEAVPELACMELSFAKTMESGEEGAASVREGNRPRLCSVSCVNHLQQSPVAPSPRRHR